MFVMCQSIHVPDMNDVGNNVGNKDNFTTTTTTTTNNNNNESINCYGLE